MPIYEYPGYGNADLNSLYGIWDSYVPSSLSERDQDALLTKIREKRWSIYVAQAAKRFESWWTYCAEPKSTMMSSFDKETTPDTWKHNISIVIEQANLPPIGTFDRFLNAGSESLTFPRRAYGLAYIHAQP